MQIILSRELTRGQSAETRAQAILRFCGIGATILIGFAGYIYTDPFSLFEPLDINIYIIVSLLLIKASYYSIKTIAPHQLMAERSVFAEKLIEIDYISILKLDLDSKKAIHDNNLSKFSRKLLFLHRATRNVAAFIFCSITFGIILATRNYISFPNTELYVYIIFTLQMIIIATLIMLDNIVEKAGKMWTNKQNE